MLYLEDYLELIEHLPQELRDRLTLIRENDLKVNNSSLHIDTKVKQFFAEAKKLSPEERQCNYQDILNDYESTLKHADDKVQIADQTQEIMMKLIQKLDGELEKFKLELEADHAGITEELERRSLELDADSRLDDTINGYLNNSYASIPGHPRKSSAFKDRRRSEHRHHQRHHHPYQINHQDNGYQVKAKLSQNHNDPYNTSSHKQMPRYHQHDTTGRQSHNRSKNSRQNSAATSPTPYGANLSSTTSAPASVAGDHMINGIEINGGHYNNNLTSFGNNPGFKNSYKNNNPSYNHQHSALSAALSSSTAPSSHSMSTFAMMNSSIQANKISNNGANLSGADPNDPLAAAASHAIAATQQLQQGRRTPSLKASYEAIKAGLNHLDPLGYSNKQESAYGRNALAPMAPDQQASRYNQQYGKMNSNGTSSPLYVSVTKSGRPSKRPKHHASHLYPDESPTSITSDNSVFENSESLSSAEFFNGTSPVFGSASPSSFDFNNSRVNDQSGTMYQRDETLYCICRQISYGEMVACDNEECEIEWFHYGCVGITQSPKGKWYCPDCSKSTMSIQNNNHTPTQTQKKRGRKEKSVLGVGREKIPAQKSIIHDTFSIPD